MTHETGKAMIRRMHDARFATRWFRGAGIDIGAGDDSLSQYQHLFPGITSVRSYDKDDGDANTMENIEEGTYDFVYSSHCWEHMRDPYLALRHWQRICKPGGYLIIVVPDYDLYEQGQWPSHFNMDHKWCFSISGKIRQNTHIVLTREPKLFVGLDVLKIELVDRGYLHGAMSIFDQSLNMSCEPAIEIIAQKC